MGTGHRGHSLIFSGLIFSVQIERAEQKNRMAIDEEQPEFALDISRDAKRTLQEKLASSGVTGALSLIPGVGAAVTQLMTELAIQRQSERMKEIFDHFTHRIQDIGEDKVDREWFRSEEFQTLLYESFQQLLVTHDRQKIEMLGVALANSGAPGFKDEDRKDLFVRFVRELTSQHLKVLLSLVPQTLRFDSTEPPMTEEEIQLWKWRTRPKVSPSDDDLLAMQMLTAYGLVEENISASINPPSIPSSFTSENQIRNAVKKISKSLEKPSITRTFRLSPLGGDFLKFMGLPKPEAQNSTVS
jgi:hypothetical protein